MLRLPATMLLQIAVAALATAIGVLALRVPAVDGGQHAAQRQAWSHTGAAFLLMGLSGLAQSGFGSWAILAGSASGVWSAFMRWSPAMNHSRNGVEAALLLLLLLLIPSSRPSGPGTRPAWGLLLLGLVAGAVAGWAEGPLVSTRHYTVVARVDTLLFAAWALVLGASLLADTVDRWLVVVLVLWAVPLPLNALWFFWLSRAETGTWTPRPLDMQIYRLLLHLAILAATVHRWVLARRGIPVTGIGGRLAADAQET